MAGIRRIRRGGAVEKTNPSLFGIRRATDLRLRTLLSGKYSIPFISFGGCFFQGGCINAVVIETDNRRN
jgi:hypothetical protein